MNLNQAVSGALRSFRRDVPEFVAAGVVDMSTGMLLGVDTVDDHPQEVLDMVAAATADLMQGHAVSRIEDIWRQRRGSADTGHYFNEMLVNSERFVHLFLRSRANPDLAAIVVCASSVNVGMLFAQGRLVLRELDAGLAPVGASPAGGQTDRR